MTIEESMQVEFDKAVEVVKEMALNEGEVAPTIMFYSPDGCETMDLRTAFLSSAAQMAFRDSLPGLIRRHKAEFIVMYGQASIWKGETEILRKMGIDVDNPDTTAEEVRKFLEPTHKGFVIEATSPGLRKLKGFEVIEGKDGKIEDFVEDTDMTPEQCAGGGAFINLPSVWKQVTQADSEPSEDPKPKPKKSRHEYKIKSVTPVKDLKPGEIRPIPDEWFFDDGKLIEFDRIYQDKSYEVTGPGIFTLERTSSGIVLNPTNFTNDPMYDKYLYTDEITSRIRRFFDKIHVYKKYGMFPRRGLLLYGPPGCGKSVAVSKAVQGYEDALVLIWPTAAIHAYYVAEHLRITRYSDSIKKVFLVMEDIGGEEVEDREEISADSELLGLLDNTQEIFKVPTMILATTNYPDQLVHMLTNRPGRFDDVISIGYPPPERRNRMSGGRKRIS